MAGGNPKGKPSSSASHHRKSRWESSKNPSSSDHKSTGGATSSSTPKEDPSKPIPGPGLLPPPSFPINEHGGGPPPPPLADPPGFGPPPPPAYGFHKLERRTIFLADGSVRSYFALPPDYQDFPPQGRPGPMDPPERFLPFGEPDHQGRLGFDRHFHPGGPLSPEGFRLDRGGGGGQHDYWNSLGLDGRGPIPPEGGAMKRKYGDDRDDFARQRQQLLQYGNSSMNPNGFPGERRPFFGGTTSPFGRDMLEGGRGRDMLEDPRNADEMRAPKQMRYDLSGGHGGADFGMKQPDVDPQALKRAFLHFVKLINENASQRNIYLEDGKAGPLQCLACPSGALSDRSKSIIFSMARLDRVKNITGLVEWYAKSPRLRELVNLVVVAGYIDVKKSNDREEINESEKMYGLMKQYELNGQFRWISAQMNRAQNGELYRYIADTKGAFVQPALYEAFGLTVVEAMTCGLPTFSTCHGGPTEIMEHGISGFHVDPYHLNQAADVLVEFFDQCQKDPEGSRPLGQDIWAPKDFPDMHGLLLHAYNSHNPDLHVDHLGFHKALCVLMGWNYNKVPDNSKAYRSLSADQAEANKEDLILWPPVVIIHNTNTGRGKEGRMEGIGNKVMDNKLKDLGFGGGKSKSLYGKDGHQGITLVKFAGDKSGLKEAAHLADYFEKDKHGRKGWVHAQSTKSGTDDDSNPNLVKVDEKMGKTRILYGYLASASDLEKVDFETRKRAEVESRKELKA